MMAQQFATTWWSQGIALFLAVGTTTFLAWRWEGTKNWTKAAKILSTLAIAAIGVILFSPKIYADYIDETAPPDNLLASFSFPDPKQIGRGEIDFSMHLTNRGTRPVMIKDMGVFVAVSPVPTPQGQHPCSLQQVDPKFLDMWYADGTTPTAGKEFGKDRRLAYYAQRSSLPESAGASIMAKSEKTIRARVAGKAREARDETQFVCPVIRYIDFDGTEIVAICDGYVLIMSGPFLTMPVSNWSQFRLLPHSKTLECTAEQKSEKGFATIAAS